MPNRAANDPDRMVGAPSGDPLPADLQAARDEDAARIAAWKEMAATPDTSERLTREEAERRYGLAHGIDVEVRTARGVAVIHVSHNTDTDTYGLRFTGDLFDQAPDAVAVAIQTAMRSVQKSRNEAN